MPTHPPINAIGLQDIFARSAEVLMNEVAV